MLTLSTRQAMIENKGNGEVSNMSGPVSFFTAHIQIISRCKQFKYSREEEGNWVIISINIIMSIIVIIKVIMFMVV